MKSITFSAIALVMLMPLAACSQSGQTSSQQASADTTAQAATDANDKSSASGISGEIQKAMQKAKQELASKNIDVNNINVGDSHHHDNDSRPKAEITPQGDLLIAGKQVAATPAQHALLLDYRAQIIAIADKGMDIGTQGADLGVNAAKQAIIGALSGKSDKDIDAQIKPQTDKIQAAALQLCQRLPDLLSSQQKLAAAMPEFRPYATMNQHDVDDCSKNMTDKDGKKGGVIFSD